VEIHANLPADVPRRQLTADAARVVHDFDPLPALTRRHPSSLL
jgi:hypothetical protein